jgi:hypothetical protein
VFEGAFFSRFAQLHKQVIEPPFLVQNE